MIGQSQKLKINKTIFSAIFLMLAVCVGAFGAHAFSETLSEYGKDIFETASFYHFIHALGMLVVSDLSSITNKQKNKIVLIFALGIILFSGSLYALAITKIKILGAITPFGGTLFIVGWGYLAWISRKESTE